MFRLKEHQCSQCDYVFDMATSASERGLPKEGDISICFKCGHIAMFNADTSVRDFKEGEWEEIDEEVRNQILAQQQFLKLEKMMN